MVNAIETPVDSGNTFFDIFLNTDQIGMVFEADTPKKTERNMSIYSDFRTKIWLQSY